MNKYVIYSIIGVAVLFMLIFSQMQFNQCMKDGYNQTQCMMMISATNTTNQNVFGVQNNASN